MIRGRSVDCISMVKYIFVLEDLELLLDMIYITSRAQGKAMLQAPLHRQPHYPTVIVLLIFPKPLKRSHVPAAQILWGTIPESPSTVEKHSSASSIRKNFVFLSYMTVRCPITQRTFQSPDCQLPRWCPADIYRRRYPIWDSIVP